MLILAAHDPVDHVLPHRFFKLLDFNFQPFGRESIPLLNIDFGPRAFYFTNHLLMTLVAAGLCVLIFPRIARSYRRESAAPQAPRGMANLFEGMLQFIREDVARPILAHRTDAFMPFLWTLFFFILFCNLLGMVPLDSMVYLVSGKTIRHVGGTATGNLAVTGGLAICAFFAIHVSGVREVFHGLVAGTYGHHDQSGHGEADQNHPAPGHRSGAVRAAVMAFPLYMWNFAPHVFAERGPRQTHSTAARVALVAVYAIFLALCLRLMFLLFGHTASIVGQWMGLVFGLIAGLSAGGVHPSDFLDALMWVLLLLLEFIGAAIKPFALMIRLFANMIAGHIVLASILMLIFVIGKYTVGVASAFGCLAISCLELFVAFLQAYIFVFLTALFIGAAVEPEH